MSLNKMKFFFAALFALVISMSVPSQAATVGGSYPITATDGQVLVLSGKTFSGKNMADLLSQTIVDCAANSTNRNKCLAFFSFADPRWWGNGTNVCTSNFNSNNNVDDDSSEIQSAISSGYPVRIPKPGCKLANRVTFTNDRQTIFGEGTGGGYNHNYMGSGAYIFLPNDLWTNRSTSLNCAIDIAGYDNSTIRNISFRANFGLVGSVAVCNSIGIQGGRAAAFVNMENVMFGNLGNGVGAALTSYFDYDDTSTTSNTLGTGTMNFTASTGKLWQAGDVINATAIGISPTTRMTGTVTSYNSGTGALVMNSTSTTGTAGTYANWNLNTSNKCVPITTGAQAVLNNNVFQVRAKGVDMIGLCMGMYGNFSDTHVEDYYGASISHNIFSSLTNGFGGSGDLINGRVEYSGMCAGPSTALTCFGQGAGIYYNTPLYLNIANLSCDHQYGACVKGGSGGKNINLSNVASFGSYYTAGAGRDNCHFVFEGVSGLTASGINTLRNGVDTPYVACFSGTNTNVNWSGAGGAQGSGAATGQWQTAYFNFTTTPTNFTYNVPGVGFFTDSGVPTTLGGLVGYTETPFDAGNSGTAKTIDLANGTFQKLTATGNATITMPTAVNGKSFTLRYYTGAGSFSATFTGVKWPSGTVPTLTTTAARMDVFTFISDGTNWYGAASQDFTP